MKIQYSCTANHTIAHLTSENWQEVNRIHLRKVLTEFIHEEMIHPVLVEEEQQAAIYRLNIPEQTNCYYQFEAKVLPLHHFSISIDSIQKWEHELMVPLDSLKFFIEFRSCIGISDALLPEYLEEMISTINGMAHIRKNVKPSAHKLAYADYQTIEGAMLGHPRFIANNGRIGLDAEDYLLYAPESSHMIQLLWLAGHKSLCIYAAINALDYEDLMESELGEDCLTQFNEHLCQAGLNPNDYYFFPVHPWQWKNKIAQIFSGDIASQNLVYLGYSNDRYLPQQSIRTFYNMSAHHKCYVKTAMSIVNMGYIRGLSPKFMKSNPFVNEWLCGFLEQDAYLKQTGFTILKEIASVSFINQRFLEVSSEVTPYQKMLACLWRESPENILDIGEELMTMAALLHVDYNGKSMLQALINRSGLSAQTWIITYLRSYMKPLLHCFYQWDLVYMPHGENIILVMQNAIPVRILMKDIGEEISLLNWEKSVPEEVERLKVTVSETNRTLPIFTQLIDSIFRFISAILVESEELSANEFWSLVANVIHEYQDENKHLSDKFKKYSLFVAQFQSDALNRMHFRNNKELRNRKDPFSGKENVGFLINPLTSYEN